MLPPNRHIKSIGDNYLDVHSLFHRIFFWRKCRISYTLPSILNMVHINYPRHHTSWVSHMNFPLLQNLRRRTCLISWFYHIAVCPDSLWWSSAELLWQETPNREIARHNCFYIKCTNDHSLSANCCPKIMTHESSPGSNVQEFKNNNLEWPAKGVNKLQWNTMDRHPIEKLHGSL